MDNEAIRVLNLFTILNHGGAETMVMNYYRHIDRTKVQFDFIVHREEKGEYEEEIEKLGGRIFRFPPVRPWTESSYREIAARFYREHPEYKIIHSHMSELGCYDFMEAKKAGVPVRICHAHNRQYGFDIKSPIRWYYKKRMMPYVSDLFMCGLESGEWLFGKKNSSKFIQLNNAIDVSKYVFSSDVRNSLRAEMGVEGKLVIGHVGRFDPQKNHTLLLEIFRKIHKINPDSILLLVGDDKGKRASEFHNRVRDYGLDAYVRFLGVRNDVADIMQAMDVFLFPSLFEGFGIVALEAQAAGLPTIVSDRIPEECMITDLIEKMPLSSPAELWAEKVLSVLSTNREDMFDVISKAGFDIVENAKRLQEFYIHSIER